MRRGGPGDLCKYKFWISADCSSFSEKVSTMTKGITYWMSRFNFKKSNLGALDSPGCHNHSLITSNPRSYILNRTSHLQYKHIHLNPFTHLLLSKKKKKKNKKKSGNKIKLQSPLPTYTYTNSTHHACVQGPLWEGIRVACGPTYYCATHVCVPDFLGGLAVGGLHTNTQTI